MRRKLGLVALVAGAAAALAIRTAGAEPPATIVVEQGTLATPAPDSNGVLAFRGIPFAAAPTGDRRWRPPAPPANWPGVREASAFGPACPQRLAGSRLPWTEPFMHDGGVDEDCLYLNVWTEAEALDASRPVFVYLHGGGFNEGSGSVPVYDGAALARRGLVVVTINYRLGALGFLAHPELTAESPASASGNYGLLDQVAALEWVRRNIARFGGNPGNVTIAGQSAGAMSVYLLVASPLTEGLFDRAVSQSGPGALPGLGGPSLAGSVPSRADAEADGLGFAASKGDGSIATLRALPWQSIIESGDGPALRFRPVIDGHFLPRDIGAIFAAGDQQRVPLIAGMNADEGSAFLGYSDRSDDEIEAGRRDAISAMQSIANEYSAAGGARVYLYYFERAIPWPEHPEYGAFHTGEVPYVFDNLSKLDRPWTAVDRRLADVVSAYWTNFARQGNPNGDGRPRWPDIAGNERAVMVLGESVRAKEMPR